MAINLDHQLNTVNTSTSDINFDITGSLKVPVGSTAQRTATLSGGELRFNTTDNLFEGYNGTNWLSLGVLEDNTIGSLLDVDLTGIQTGQLLKWNGSSFVAGDDQEDLSNNTTDDLAQGVTNLYYTDGRVDTRISATSIDSLSDVDTTSSAPSNGQALVWNSTTSQWAPGTVSGSGSGSGIDEGDAIAFAIALGS